MGIRYPHKEPIDYADAELDLHGCSSLEARTELAAFLAEARMEKWKTVRVIVGKGTRSPEGPVLPSVVQEELKARDLRWTYAPPRYGGEGALEVELPF